MKNTRIYPKFLMILIFAFILLAVPFSTALAAGRLASDLPKFDLNEFLTYAGLFYIPTLAIVFGLVDYYGKWGVQGKAQLASSLITGLILGGAIMYFTTYPDTSVAWFSTVLYGLLCGLGASGCYNGLKKATTSGSAASLGLPEEKGKG